MKEQKNSQENKKKKISSKQVVAIIGILLLVLLYLVTLIAAFIDNSASNRLFAMCLFATLAVPILIWLYIWMYGKLTGKHVITDAPNQDAVSHSSTKDEHKA